MRVPNAQCGKRTIVSRRCLATRRSEPPAKISELRSHQWRMTRGPSRIDRSANMRASIAED